MKVKCPLLLKIPLKKNQQNIDPSTPQNHLHFNVSHPVYHDFYTSLFFPELSKMPTIIELIIKALCQPCCIIHKNCPQRWSPPVANNQATYLIAQLASYRVSEGKVVFLIGL